MKTNANNKPGLFSGVATAKLLISLEGLELAIHQARIKVARSNSSDHSELASRLNQYLVMLTNSKRLALTLVTHIENQAWEEVHRTVALVQGTSKMIQDDVLSLMAHQGGVIAGTHELQ